MTKDEALKMCLEYIETDSHERKYVRHAIKEALAQDALDRKAENARELGLDYEPEHWEKFCDSNCVWTDHHSDCKLAQPVVDKSAAVRIATALGWTPQRTWVGLSDVNAIELWQLARHDIVEFARVIEAKLKENNTSLS